MLSSSNPSFRLGMLTPSSNTVLEPVTNQHVHSLPDVTAHYSRFRVTEIGLSSKALSQFDQKQMLEAARLLAEAKVDVLAWAGTSASWLGFEHDELLCRQLEQEFNVRTCTSVLAFREIFERKQNPRIGLVTPYTSDVQSRIMENFNASGYRYSAQRHLNLSDNFSFGQVGEETLIEMSRAVAAEGCDAVAIVCTNLRGAGVVPLLEAELGIPVYDSISVTIWKSLEIVGYDTRRLSNWGSLFTDAQLSGISLVSSEDS